MTRFQFVADHSDAFEVKRLCELVEIERSSFYAWKAAAPARAARVAADADLVGRIRVVHEEDKTWMPDCWALTSTAPGCSAVRGSSIARRMAVCSPSPATGCSCCRRAGGR